MALRYKIEGSSHPLGKPRVYFCCHPEDYSLYFEAISKELLAIQDCAVWYALPTDLRDEAFLEDLKQMHLFVMPVTHRLLTQPSYALDVEFRFAIREHIPVLPLLQEPELRELFSQKCGDLQYLHKNAQDVTAIPYEDKLRKYLESVLIGDDLAQQIRDAFDAYVFLSYRKKDRKHAQELMRLIHKNDFCRDLAIWYDEFLIPGKSFHDAIREAMKKSSLVVLAVTPNLVNEVNFVMTTEYPMARQLDKPVLSAELVPTDRKLLSEKYPALPDPADPYDGEAFRARLRSMAGSLSKGNTSKEHDYFIGLAYLRGLDVEVDYDRALALITGAAEAGLVAAAQKLVDIYQTGTGVARNLEAAIVWQERLMGLYAQAYDTDPTAENAGNLIWALLNCGDMYTALHRYPLAKKRYAKAMETAKMSAGKNRSGEDIWNLLACFERLSSAESGQGKLQAAKMLLEQGLKLGRRIAGEMATPETWHALATVCAKLGDIAREQGEPERAKALFAQYLELSLKIAEKTGTVQARRNIAVGYQRLGIVAKNQGDLEEAKELFRKAANLHKRLHKATGLPEHASGLCIAWLNQGDIARAQGDLNAAKLLYENALALWLELECKLASQDARRALSVCYDKLGDIALAQEDHKTADGFYQKGLAIHQELAEQTGTPDALRDLSVSYDRLGNIARQQGDLNAAKALYEKALALTEKLAAESQTVAILQNLTVGCNKLADIARTQGDLTSARAYLEKAMALHQRIAQGNGTPEVSRNLSASYDLLGELSRTQGDLESARSYYKKALKVRQRAAERAATAENLRNLSASYNNIVHVALAQGELSAARTYMEKSLAISEDLAEKVGTPESLRDLSVSYDRLGDIALAQRNKSGARTFYTKALQLRQQLADRTRSPQSYDDLAVSHFNLAKVCPQQRREYLKAAVAIYALLAQQFPEVPRYRQNRDSIQRVLNGS